jgi:hypothetical protein
MRATIRNVNTQPNMVRASLLFPLCGAFAAYVERKTQGRCDWFPAANHLPGKRLAKALEFKAI